MPGRTDLKSWQRLSALAVTDGERHLRTEFDVDPGRAARFSGEAAGLFVDYSKTRITDDIVSGLLRLADDCGVTSRL